MDAFVFTAIVGAVALTPPASVLPDISSYGGGASVDVGETNGLRGLVATRAAQVGDVLLEVPLSLCACDFGAETPIAVEPPTYARDLPWNVQLACSLMSRQKGLELLIDSLPAQPPTLPMFACSEPELSLAGDEAFARLVSIDRKWCDEQFDLVSTAASADAEAAASDHVDHVDPHAFRQAIAFVLSRSLRITAPKPVGTRRVLVPALDLTNHAERPSAIYSYSATRGGVMRLHAARRIEEGEQVTIKYGDDLSSAHYATYYGFVPLANAQDSVRVPLAKVMAHAPPPLGAGQPAEADGSGTAPSASLGSAGSGWWTADRLREAGVDGAAMFDLHESAPSVELLATMRALLSSGAVGAPAAGFIGGFGQEEDALLASALRAVGKVAEEEAERLVERAEAAAADAGADAADTADAEASRSEGVQLLLELRQSRLELLMSLSRSMNRIAERFEAGGGMAAAARVMLEGAVLESETQPYPVSQRQLENWQGREWDWDAYAFAYRA